MSRGCAIAWSSSANLGPGFDVMALAHTAYYDLACVEVEKGGGVRVSVHGPFSAHVSHPTTAEVAVRRALEVLGEDVGATVTLWKGIPVSAGLGGSAASAVAALRALEQALDEPMPTGLLVRLAGEAEAVSAGSPHFDNAAASAVGGLVLVSRAGGDVVVRSLRPKARFVVLRPLVAPVPMKTKVMREALPRAVELERHVEDMSRALMLALALAEGDLELAGKMMEDSIVTPARAPHVPCFGAVRGALLKAGAYGVAISGAGPSLIALGPQDSLDELAKVGLAAYESCGLPAEAKVVEPSRGSEPVSPDEASRLAGRREEVIFG